MKSIRILFVLGGLFAYFQTKGQLDLCVNYIFSEDSISGFNDDDCANDALINKCYGLEKKYFIYKAKRYFIKQKYHLKDLSYPLLSFKTYTIPGTVCDNIDFELITADLYAPSVIQGWSVQSGTNIGGCAAPVFNGSTNYTVYSGPITDPFLGQPVSSYFGTSTLVPSGSSFIRLNNNSSGAKVAQISKSFIVDSSSTLLKYAFLPVFEDGGHYCCDQPILFINLTVTDTLTNISTSLTCQTVSLIASGSGCNFTSLGNATGMMPTPGYPYGYYLPWTANSINLLPYLNNLVKIDITVMDCSQGGHFGYTYFDAKCSGEPLKIYCGGSSLPASNSIFNFTTCVPYATVYIPFPFSQITSTLPFNYASQVFFTIYPGAYTLSVFSASNCPVTTKTLNIFFSSINTLITSSDATICPGQAVTLSVTGTSDFLWSTGDTASTTIVTPTATIEYSVHSTNGGCSGIDFTTIHVNPCTGILKRADSKWRLNIYPNPNQGEFILKVGENIGRFELVVENTLGQIIYRRQFDENANIIKMYSVPGLYYYAIIQNKIPLANGKFQIE